MFFGCRKTILKMKKIREILKKVSKSGAEFWGDECMVNFFGAKNG